MTYLCLQNTKSSVRYTCFFDLDAAQQRLYSAARVGSFQIFIRRNATDLGGVGLAAAAVPASGGRRVCQPVADS